MNVKEIKRPHVRFRKYANGKKIYFIDYLDISTGKRIRKKVGERKDIAVEYANRIFEELRQDFLGISSKKTELISVTDLIKVFAQSKQGKISDATINRYRIHADHLISFLSHNICPRLNTPTKSAKSTWKNIWTS